MQEVIGDMIFQSTLPVWGGTKPVCGRAYYYDVFQSTLPVWGGTCFSGCFYCGDAHFNPPCPCGEGLMKLVLLNLITAPFQSTLPVWGGTGSPAIST